MVSPIIIILATIGVGYFLYCNLWLNPDSNLITIYTPWGEKLDKDNVLQEYPRPQYERNSYMNLNGLWDYALLLKNEKLKGYEGKILVPFSIESPLSGVQRTLKPGMKLVYNRKINLTKLKNEGRYIINFGGVDQETDVYINNKHVGNHKGGYLSFSFDITEAVKTCENLEEVDLRVEVIDNWRDNGEGYGKQANPRGNIWYTVTGGIWQTVWIESVPVNYLKNVKITPKYDEKKVVFEPEYILSNKNNQKASYEIIDKSGQIIKGEFSDGNKTEVKLPDKIYSWSPESPDLYKVIFTFDNDKINSYFAMRKFSIGQDSKGIKRLFLNNIPYFHNGLLDQGYWSDGYYTAPSDEALKYDIVKMKELGFNMLRKHIKVEPMRWYYHCDTIGMLVWQDMINGGSSYSPLTIQILPTIGISLPDNWYSFFGRDEEESRNTYYRELEEMINQLYNVPSIATWVPFNEGWGQFDALKAVEFIKNIDTSRHIDHASGWHDQKGGDFKSLHIYFVKIDISNKIDKNRVLAISEFGGYSYTVNDHVGSDHQYGYSIYKTQEEFNKAYINLFVNEIIPSIPLGLSATVYTQVTDVEDEVNGLLTYDRKVLKVNENEVKEVNKEIQYLNKVK